MASITVSFWYSPVIVGLIGLILLVGVIRAGVRLLTGFLVG